MASTGGAHYAFFAQGAPVNVVVTPDGKRLPQPNPASFNLELVTSLSGPTVIPTGYQGVALMSPDGKTLVLASGNYGARDTGAGAGADTITAGSGNDTIYGGKATRLIAGGSGADVIYAGVHESVVGGAGPATIVGGKYDTIAGGSGTLSVDGSAGRERITAGSGQSTIVAAQHDTVIGTSGDPTIELGGGPSTINLGSGADYIVDKGIKSSATVTGFDQIGGDRISFAGETTALINHVVATAKSTATHTIVSFPDGTTLTLLGVRHIDATFFK